MDTEKVIIIRYAEIHLKGKNRGYFERVFSVNLERALKGQDLASFRKEFEKRK